jgi:hypothetical protein
MSGMQTKGGHSISKNSVGNALNRTPKRKINMLNIDYKYFI